MLTLTLTNTNPNPHRGLGRSLGETKAEVRGLRAEVVQQRMQMQQLLEMQRQLLASQLGAVATAPAGLSSSLSPGCPVPDGPAAPSTPSAAVGIEAHSVVSRWLVLGLSVVASVIFLGDPGSWT